MANKMPLEQAQGVAIRCVDKVGGQDSELDDVLNTVGIPDIFAVRALRREIVHGDEGVQSEGFTMKTEDLSSITPESTVDDVAEAIHANAEPSADEDNAGDKAGGKGKSKDKDKAEGGKGKGAKGDKKE
jgi:hypothetical protein